MSATYGYIRHPHRDESMAVRITRSEFGMGWYMMACSTHTEERRFQRLESWLERHGKTDTFWQYKIIFIPAAREFKAGG